MSFTSLRACTHTLYICTLLAFYCLVVNAAELAQVFRGNATLVGSSVIVPLGSAEFYNQVDKCFLSFSYSHASSDPRIGMINGALTPTADGVAFLRFADDMSPVVINWHVACFYSGVEVQHSAIVTFGDTLSKAFERQLAGSFVGMFALFQYAYNGTTWTENDYARLDMTGPLPTVHCSVSMVFGRASLQLVKYEGVVVEHAVTDNLGGKVFYQKSFAPPFYPPNHMLLFSFTNAYPSSTARVSWSGEYTASGVEFRRYFISSEPGFIAYQIVKFVDGTTVIHLELLFLSNSFISYALPRAVNVSRAIPMVANALFGGRTEFGTMSGQVRPMTGACKASLWLDDAGTHLYASRAFAVTAGNCQLPVMVVEWREPKPQPTAQPTLPPSGMPTQMPVEATTTTAIAMGGTTSSAPASTTTPSLSPVSTSTPTQSATGGGTASNAQQSTSDNGATTPLVTSAAIDDTLPSAVATSPSPSTPAIVAEESDSLPLIIGLIVTFVIVCCLLFLIIFFVTRGRRSSRAPGGTKKNSSRRASTLHGSSQRRRSVQLRHSTQLRRSSARFSRSLPPPSISISPSTIYAAAPAHRLPGPSLPTTLAPMGSGDETMQIQRPDFDLKARANASQTTSAPAGDATVIYSGISDVLGTDTPIYESVLPVNQSEGVYGAFAPVQKEGREEKIVYDTLLPPNKS